jgi:hypothetical protein
MEAVGGLRARSLILDGEVVACGEHGLANASAIAGTRPASSCTPLTSSN